MTYSSADSVDLLSSLGLGWGALILGAALMATGRGTATADAADTAVAADFGGGSTSMEVGAM